MISKERLEKLFKKEAIIYDNKGIAYKTGHQCYIQDNKFCVKYSLDSVPLEKLYETKEEAEFVAKYHCEKTIKFEPPTFEEFEKTAKKYGNQRNGWACENCIICENQDFIAVSNDYYCREFNTGNNEDSKKQAYYKAVEFAKKLFLGER